MWELPKLAAQFGPTVFLIISIMVLFFGTILFLLRLHDKQMSTLHSNHLTERKTWREDLRGILHRHERERAIDRQEQKEQADKVVGELSKVLLEIARK